jgi:hypothetical protein
LLPAGGTVKVPIVNQEFLFSQHWHFGFYLLGISLKLGVGPPSSRWITLCFARWLPGLSPWRMNVL